MKRLKIITICIAIFLLIVLFPMGFNSIEKNKEIEEMEIPMDINKIKNPDYKDFKSQAMITFSYDDGLISNYEIALPLHEKYGIPATFNIIAERAIDESFHDRFFNEEMVIDSADRGIEIASHAYSHTKALTEMTDEEVHFELSESKRILSELVDRVEILAIPFLKYDDRIENIAKEYYKGVRVYGDMLNSIPPENIYNLHSTIAVINTSTFEEIKVKIDEAIKNKEWIIIMLHGIDSKKESLYEITPDLLEEILVYVSDFDRKVLLPINTRDAVVFTEKYTNIN